jgi:hypothetical protein
MFLVRPSAIEIQGSFKQRSCQVNDRDLRSAINALTYSAAATLKWLARDIEAKNSAKTRGS